MAGCIVLSILVNILLILGGEDMPRLEAFNIWSVNIRHWQ